MTKRELLFQGKFHTVELAVTANGRCPGKEFLKSLSITDRTKILKIIERLANEGKVASREQFKKIEGENFFEFKKFQIRIPCYFQPGGRIIITHGFIKKGESVGPEEIRRMKRIRDEYEQRI
ncbi:MAG: type II toxin-antitoxin system RelE/ParE family toxin [Thermodesulfobacteriota bacterium]